MAEETPIYILVKELQQQQENDDGTEKVHESNTYYAFDDGEWVEMDDEALTGVSRIITGEPYAVLMIPHTQITFDENNKITNINLPE